MKFYQRFDFDFFDTRLFRSACSVPLDDGQNFNCSAATSLYRLVDCVFSILRMIFIRHFLFSTFVIWAIVYPSFFSRVRPEVDIDSRSAAVWAILYNKLCARCMQLDVRRDEMCVTALSLRWCTTCTLEAPMISPGRMRSCEHDLTFSWMKSDIDPTHSQVLHFSSLTAILYGNITQRAIRSSNRF